MVALFRLLTILPLELLLIRSSLPRFDSVRSARPGRPTPPVLDTVVEVARQAYALKVAYYQGFYRAHGAVHHPHIKKTANCRPCPIAHVRAERLAERAHLHTTMWSSCPDPTPSLIASAFAGGAVALACDYLRRVAVLRAALPRQSDRSCLPRCPGSRIARACGRAAVRPLAR